MPGNNTVPDGDGWGIRPMPTLPSAYWSPAPAKFQRLELVGVINVVDGRGFELTYALRSWPKGGRERPYALGVRA